MSAGVTEELKPCPFCGCHGLSLAWPRARDKLVAIIECHTDNCYATIEAETPRKAITAWNTRATEAEFAAREAALVHTAIDLLQHVDWLTNGLPALLENAGLADEEGLIGAAVDAANSARAALAHAHTTEIL